MTVNLCTVSGTLVAPDGSPMSAVEVRFLPAPVSLRSQGGATLAPQPVATVTDAAAGLSVGLVPGVYTLRARAPEGREYPPCLIDVPVAETADLAEILLHLPAPQSVYDAAASARTASNAAATAIAAAAGAGSGGGSGGGEGGGPVDWADVTDKPATFPPAPHGHALAEIADFPTLAPVATSGAYGDLAGRPVLGTAAAADVAAFAPVVHGHALAEVTGLQAALDAKAAAAPFSDTLPGLVPAAGAGTAERFLRADGQFAGLFDSGQLGPVHASRAAFAAADLPAPVQRWAVLHAGLVLDYVRDDDATAIESDNGAKGSPAGTVRPEHWGAAGDGTTDDTAAIQAAIDWLEGQGGGKLLFRARRYVVSSPVHIRRNVWLVGEGWRFQGDYTNSAVLAGTWIELAPGSDCDVIVFRAQPGPSETVRQRLHAGMRDIGVHGRKSDSFSRTATDLNATGRGIRLEGVSYVTLDNVCAFRCAEMGVSTGSFDYGGDVGLLSCNNLNWRNVVAIGNASHGIEIFAGDSTYSQLIAGFNGGIGIRSGDGPLIGCRAWNNDRQGFALSRPLEMVGCESYDNRRSGVRISGERITISACKIWSNGGDETQSTTDRAGIEITGDAQDIVITGNTIDNRPGKPATQQRGIYCGLSGVRVQLGPNSIRDNVISDAFFSDWDSVSLHATGIPVNVLHPGFTAGGRIDMAGNRLHRAELLTFSTWRSTSSVSNGVLNLSNNSLCSVSIGAGATITGLSGTTLGLPLAIIRNNGGGDLTFVHDPTKLRLAGGVDRVLAQNEAILFVHVSGTIWQQVA